MAGSKTGDGDLVTIEVAWASPDVQILIELAVIAGTSVGEALMKSGIYDRVPGQGLESATVGIWGRIVDRDCPVRHGDRVEIYRPLELDPREARRRLADAGRTMSQGDGG